MKKIFLYYAFVLLPIFCFQSNQAPGSANPEAYRLVDKKALVLKQTEGVNLLTFATRPMHLWLEAVDKNTIRLSPRNGALLTQMEKHEIFQAKDCDRSRATNAPVPSEKLLVGAAFCVWLPNNNLVITRVTNFNLGFPYAAIELESSFYSFTSQLTKP